MGGRGEGDGRGADERGREFGSEEETDDGRADGEIISEGFSFTSKLGGCMLFVDTSTESCSKKYVNK